MNKACLAWVILGSLWVNANADDKLLEFPTGPAAWVVNVTAASGSGAAVTKSMKSIVKIEITQDDQKRCSKITWSSGETQERWDLPGQNLILTTDKNGQPFGILGGGMSAQIIDIPFDPSSLEWLDLKYLQEKNPISFQGKLCFHYRGAVSFPELANPTGFAPPVQCEAWVDSRTLVPVAFNNGTALGTYVFQKAPPPPLVLPAKFQSIVDRFEQRMGVVKPASAQ